MEILKKCDVSKMINRGLWRQILVALFIIVAFAMPIFAEETATENTTVETGVEETTVSAEESNATEPYERGKVLKLIKIGESNIEMSQSEGFSISNQMVEVQIIKGPHKGQTYQAEYSLSNGFSENYKVKPLEIGDEVLLHMEKNEAGAVTKVFVAEFARDKHILTLLIIFIVLLIGIGRMRGVKAIISLGITIFAVLKIMLPAILNGWDPVFISVVICVAVIIISMLLLNGINKKTVAAVIGTSGGVVAAGIVALIFGSVARLSGLGEEETQMLMYIPQKIVFNFRGLLFSGILISTMGATMDVGMSIASAMNEIKAVNPSIKPWELTKSGMNVGRDVIGTMTDTLILAYAGSSLPLMLLFMAYDTPLGQIVNWDMIASEILRAIAGSIGIIIAVPMTVLSMVAIEANEKQRKKYAGM